MNIKSIVSKYAAWFPWAAAAVLFFPVFKILFESRWETLDYTHAYFILPISLYLLWRDRDRIKASVSEAKGSAVSAVLGGVLIVVSLFVFSVGWKNDYLSVATFALIPLCFGISFFVYGFSILRFTWFPFLYLLLLIPPPMGILDSITLPMRYGISFVTEEILAFVGYPITRSGLLLQMGGHEIFMGAPCSGFRSLVTLTSLGLAYIYTVKLIWQKKIVMVASIVPLALLGNLIRVLCLCLFTYYVGENFAQKVFHDFSGLFMFILLIIGLMSLENVLVRLGKSKEVVS